jgi:hypothetical protein
MAALALTAISADC